jgi:hypothetical protein
VAFNKYDTGPRRNEQNLRRLRVIDWLAEFAKYLYNDLNGGIGGIVGIWK